MKKTLLAILFIASLFGSQRAVSQTFSLQAGDTVFSNVQPGLNKIYNKITNISASPIVITWKVIDNNLPASWTTTQAAFGVCDNVLCYNNSILSGSSQTTASITPGDESDFHLQINLDAAPTGSAFLKVNLRPDVGASKNAVFVITKSATNVTSVFRSEDDITLYPNPARDAINVVFDANAGVRSISIHNIIGKQVGVYKVSGGSAKIDIDELPAGGYFIRLADAQGRILGTRKFTHQ